MYPFQTYFGPLFGPIVAVGPFLNPFELPPPCSYLAICGEDLNMTFDLPYTEFLPSTISYNFDIQGEQLDLSLFLPETNTSRDMLYSLDTNAKISTSEGKWRWKRDGDEGKWRDLCRYSELYRSNCQPLARLLLDSAIVSLILGMLCESVASHGSHRCYGVFWLASTYYDHALFHEEIQDSNKEAIEAEEHAKISSNIGEQNISIIDKVMLLHFIVSWKWKSC